MGRSQETSGKKEVRNRKEKKRKEKAQKRARKKNEGRKSSFDEKIAYVDEFGRISSTPVDPDRKTEIAVENIQLSAAKILQESNTSLLRKGVVTYFNESKGFGFIRDLESDQRIFVHANGLVEPVIENNLFVFDLVKGPKGPSAMNFKLFRE